MSAEVLFLMPMEREGKEDEKNDKKDYDAQCGGADCRGTGRMRLFRVGGQYDGPERKRGRRESPDILMSELR